MNAARQDRGGSRFLYAPFDMAHARIEANERVAEERWSALEYRLGRIEASMERVEKRLWLAVYGVVAVVVAQGAASLIGAI